MCVCVSKSELLFCVICLRNRHKHRAERERERGILMGCLSSPIFGVLKLHFSSSSLCYLTVCVCVCASLWEFVYVKETNISNWGEGVHEGDGLWSTDLW